jgi:hypothetical protein
MVAITVQPKIGDVPNAERPCRPKNNSGAHDPMHNRRHALRARTLVKE